VVTSGIGFVDRLADFAERPAVVTPAGSLTYAELAGRVTAAREGLGRTRRLVLVEAENHLDCLVAYLGALAGNHAVLLVPGAAPGGSRALVERYDPDVVAGPGPGGWSVRERRPGSRHLLHHDLALLLGTSGSAGSPKLVRLSRENLTSNAEAIAAILGIADDDRAITSLPVSYCYGLSVVHSHLQRGASLVLTGLSVLDDGFWDLVARHGVTALAGVPHTFDLLDRIGWRAMDLPSLRLVTQAGGRLAPDRVRRYAELGAARGWDFVVMYGQTEATARMAFLPPALAASRPAAVGVPVPGGSFRIEPDGTPPADGAPSAAPVGEIVYTGPNVMLGYAETPADLALGRTVTELRTGDLGLIAPDGLLEITGRRSAITKLFGIRVDLERLDADLAAQGVRACSTGTDEHLDVALAGCGRPDQVRADLARQLGLPAFAIRVAELAEIPRLPSGKPDRQATRRLLAARAATPSIAPTGDDAGGSARDDAGAAAHHDARHDARHDAHHDTAATVERLRATYAETLGRREVPAGSTFTSLGGDSLTYVALSVRLEEELGVLPAGWHDTTIEELAAQRRSRPGAWAAVETGTVARAAAIVAVVGTHSHLFTVRGGAHLLLGLAGYNFARFTLNRGTSRDHLGRVRQALARLALPSIAWIGAVALVSGAYDPATALLLNGVLGPDEWGPQWHFWFVEALVWILAIAGLVLAVPAVRRWRLRSPFAVALAAVAVGLVPRFATGELGGTDRASALYVFWIFAVGWAAAEATRRRQRVLVSLVLMAAMPGYFDSAPRAAVVAGGLLAVMWVPTVRLPRVAARVVALVAGASLYVYLTHWQVFPGLDLPAWAEVLACLALGIAVWAAVERFRHRVVPALRAVPLRSLVIPERKDAQCARTAV
jgi:acyl-CoA synthetase (AMP-forming)/AMP-acid ligase II